MNVTRLINKTLKLEYDIERSFTAGIVLKGSEVKAIRKNGCTFSSAFCYVKGGEMYVRNFHISQYKMACFQHVTDREKKLLLKKKEIIKLLGYSSKKGYTILVSEIYFNEKGLLKIIIVVCCRKSLIDKRREIIRKENKRIVREIVIPY